MKTRILKTILLWNALFFLSAVLSFAQSQYLGNWEGLFMNDFKTIVKLNHGENKGFSGNIEMYSGEKLIQNDPLSKITLSNNQLTFYIESKQTEFKGEFNNDVSVLQGEFIFPDKTKHPISLSKNNLIGGVTVNDSKAEYYSLKDKKFTANELKKDFNYLIKKLTEFHPKLYAYTPKTEYDELISKTEKSINAELTVIEFFNLIAPVVESIKCSHTGIRLPQSFQEGIKMHENFLPLTLLFEGDKAFCISNSNSNSGIAPGNEIIAINNIPVKTIQEKLYKFIPSEGKNTTTKNYYLNQNFNFLFNLIDNSSLFEIKYKNGNSTPVLSVKACKYSELRTAPNEAENEKLFSFYYDEKRELGLLTVKSFLYPDINSYIREMDAIFTILINNNSERLVIDLRGNSGGHPIFAAQLLSYLTNKEFTYFKRNNEIKEFEPLYNQMSANKLHFGGIVYVLVDGGCLSTTGHLISLIKYYTNAIFIGEEPGSTYQCNDFSIKENLPNTGIEVNIPRTTFETAISESDKMNPFEVDYRVEFSIEDYFKGDDSYIKFVNNLIL